MTAILAPSLLLCSLLVILAVASLWLRHVFHEMSTELVDEIDSILPQTQCAQCGYPGCRPYATSIPQGESVDLCVPGGPEVQAKLSQLMQTIPLTQIPSPKEELAFIKEENCIGCALCLPACPVDAIIGAKDYLHTVVADECTGCELCVTACPVDCIVMQENTKVISQNWEGRDNFESEQACVNCVQCDDACPVNISPLLLHKLASKEKRIKAFFLDNNVGAAEARYIALRKGRGDYIAFIDSDDCWHPKKLEKQITFMQKNNIAFSYT